MTLYRVIKYSRQSRGGALSLIELVLRDGNFRSFQGFRTADGSKLRRDLLRSYFCS